MTAAAYERLAGKPFFRRTIDGGFAVEVTAAGELFVVTPTEKAGGRLSQGRTLAALGFVKMPGEPFVLGVQWHPEYTWSYVQTDRMLWDAFIAACR